MIAQLADLAIGEVAREEGPREGPQSIEIGARIVAIIDAFDAMISSRPYHRGLSVRDAIDRLECAAGTQFDPFLINAFVRIARTEAPSVIGATGVIEAIGRGEVEAL